MKISESELTNATKFYIDLKRKFDKDPTDSNLSAMGGAGRVLSMIGIDVENLGKHYHCPVCGWHYGKGFIRGGYDPECPRCGWMGKY